MLPALAQLAGHLFWRAAARVGVLAPSALPVDVDLHAYTVLVALPAGTTRSQQELADLVMTSRTTMTRCAAQLTEHGLVDRVRNPADRRSYALTRTVAGARALVRWRPQIDVLEGLLTGGFAPAERRELAELLEVVVRADLPEALPDELRASTGFLITRIHARMHRDLLAAFETLDIEPRDFGSLNALIALGAVSQSELARTLGVSGPTVVEIADRLEARGLLVREPAPHDRRTRLLRTTPAAAEMLRRARVSADRVEHDHLGHLGAEQRLRLLELLLRFVNDGRPS